MSTDRMGKRCVPCPHGSRSIYKSLATMVVEWLDAHPDDSLLTSDIQIRFGVRTRGVVTSAMSEAARKGRVARTPHAHGRATEWFSICAAKTS